VIGNRKTEVRRLKSEDGDGMLGCLIDWMIEECAVRTGVHTSED